MIYCADRANPLTDSVTHLKAFFRGASWVWWREALQQHPERQLVKKLETGDNPVEKIALPQSPEKKPKNSGCFLGRLGRIIWRHMRSSPSRAGAIKRILRRKRRFSRFLFLCSLPLVCFIVSDGQGAGDDNTCSNERVNRGDFLKQNEAKNAG